MYEPCVSLCFGPSRSRVLLVVASRSKFPCHGRDVWMSPKNRIVISPHSKRKGGPTETKRAIASQICRQAAQGSTFRIWTTTSSFILSVKSSVWECLSGPISPYVMMAGVNIGRGFVQVFTARSDSGAIFNDRESSLYFRSSMSHLKTLRASRKSW